MLNRIRHFPVVFATAGLALTLALPARADRLAEISNEPSSVPVIFDVAVMRPIGLLTCVVGATVLPGPRGADRRAHAPHRDRQAARTAGRSAAALHLQGPARPPPEALSGLPTQRTSTGIDSMPVMKFELRYGGRPVVDELDVLDAREDLLEHHAQLEPRERRSRGRSAPRSRRTRDAGSGHGSVSKRNGSSNTSASRLPDG